MVPNPPCSASNPPNGLSQLSSKENLSREIALIAIASFIFLVTVTILSAQLFPVWLDEVLLLDPGANLWLGNGFTSSAWYYQTYDEFWACNSPLYSFLMSFWLNLFGLSVTTSRFINYGLIILALGILWLAVYRLNLIQTARDRMIALLLFGLSAGVSFNYLSGRYDCLAIVLFSSLILAYSFRPSWPRFVAFIGLGWLIPLSGFHLIPYAVLMAILLLFYLGRPVLQPIVLTGVGIVLGIAGLFLLYLQQGVISTFLRSLGGHSLADVELVSGMGDASVSEKVTYVLSNFFPILLARMASINLWYLGDRTFIFLYAAALLLLAVQLLERRFRWRSPLSFAITSGLIVPFVMGLARNYPHYYTWMALLPLSIGVAATLYEWRSKSLTAKPAMLGVVALLAAAILVGLPSYMVPAVVHWQDRNYQRVEEFVQQNIDPDEAVYSDFGPYHAIRKQVSFVLFPTYLDVISETDKTKISTLLIDINQSMHNYQDLNIFEVLGGEWQESNVKLDTTQFNLRIFRRAT